jgi:hypothetical protein
MYNIWHIVGSISLAAFLIPHTLDAMYERNKEEGKTWTRSTLINVTLIANTPSLTYFI